MVFIIHITLFTAAAQELYLNRIAIHSGSVNYLRFSLISTLRKELLSAGDIQILGDKEINEVRSISDIKKGKLNSREEYVRIAKKLKTRLILEMAIEQSDFLKTLVLTIINGKTGFIEDVFTQRVDCPTADLLDYSMRVLARRLIWKYQLTSNDSVQNSEKDTLLTHTLFDHTINNNVTVLSNPSGAFLYIDDLLVGKTPMALQSLNTGRHTVRIQKKGYYTSLRKIICRKDSASLINVNLIDEKGIIIVDSDYNPAQIYLDGIYVGDTRGILKNIEFGEHTVSLKKMNDTVFETIVNVKDSGGNFVLGMISTSYIQINSFPDGTHIDFDGHDIGMTPTDTLIIKIGEHEVSLNRSGYESFHSTFHTNSLEHRILNIEMEPLSQKKSILYSALLPGLGQIYAEKTLKGVVFLSTELLLIGGTIWCSERMKVIRGEYNDFVRISQESINAAEIEWATAMMREKKNQHDQTKLKRTMFIASAIGWWILNVIDRYVFEPELPLIDNQENKSTLKIELDHHMLTAGLKLAF